LAIGDYIPKTYQNGVDNVNAINFNKFDSKIDELDKYAIPRIKIKTTNEYVTNTTTLQNDNELVVSLDLANSLFEIELLAIVEGTYNSDFKCDWVVSGGVSQTTQRVCIGGTDQGTSPIYDTNANFSARNLNVANTYHGGNAGSYGSSIIERFLVTTVAIGTLQFRWAQATAVAEDTYLKTGSYIKVSRVNYFV
jgi:hypothetical protein